MRNEKSAGAVVFYRGEQIEYLLLLSRFWGFPKGQVEPGEDERETALREIREETGLDVTLIEGFREVDDYWYQRQGTRIHKQAIFFLAQAMNHDSKISWEHEDAAWLTYIQALARLKYKNLRDVLAKANDFLSRHESWKHETISH